MIFCNARICCCRRQCCPLPCPEPQPPCPPVLSAYGTFRSATPLTAGTGSLPLAVNVGNVENVIFTSGNTFVTILIAGTYRIGYDVASGTGTGTISATVNGVIEVATTQSIPVTTSPISTLVQLVAGDRVGVTVSGTLTANYVDLSLIKVS